MHGIQTAAGSDAIAPDTTGLNFYRADPSLRDLLQLYLPDALFRHIDPHLDRLGALAGDHLDHCARLADKHVPVLHHRDRFGRDEQWIEYHPAYRELERVAYGEFGIHAMSHRKGILGWPETYPSAAKHAFTYLFNQAEFGLGCPINVTDGAAMLLSRYGDDALKAKYLDGLTQTDMARLTQGAQFMTEKEGGSDVGKLTTTAIPENGHWRLTGEKWFCSNADASVIMLLARPQGAVAGTRGVGLFLMPRRLDDGTPNRYRIVRLKDKLGTRSMASGEIKLEGALAYAVGKLDRGFVQMAEMVNWSRLSNGVKSTALMRRALHDAMTVAHGRIVFGKRIVDQPLARRQLLKIMLPVEQALSLCFMTADALDRAEAGSQEARRAGAHPHAGAEIPLDARCPQGHRRCARDARRRGLHRGVRAGAPVARCASRLDLGRHQQYRRARCADARGRPPPCRKCARCRPACTPERGPAIPQGFRDRLRTLIDRAIGFAQSIAADPGNEADARRATTALYHVTSAVMLAWEGAHIHERRGDARRLLLSRLVLDHKLARQDAFSTEGSGDERAIAAMLLGDDAVPMAQAAAHLN